MRKLWLVMLLAGCSGGDPEEDPPPISSTVTVQLHWSWIQHLSPLPGCTQGVQSCAGCGGHCVNAPGCSAAYKEHCCDASKVIYASRRSEVLADYARCSITEPAAGLLSIDCPVDESTPVYYTDENGGTHLAGTPYRHTAGYGCSWSPSYPGP